VYAVLKLESRETLKLLVYEALKLLVYEALKRCMRSLNWRGERLREQKRWIEVDAC
jgi:hypothetical protein